MNIVTRAVIAIADWPQLRTDSGAGADLPQAFEDLWNATSDPRAEDAYWRIDNEAVVQGQLYEAAEPALKVLLSMGAVMPLGPGRRALVELVQQIVCGQPHETEIEAGNADLARRCKTMASEAMWLFYGWLTDSDTDIRECALLTVNAIEHDDIRKKAIFDTVQKNDRAEGVQRIFHELDHRPL